MGEVMRRVMRWEVGLCLLIVLVAAGSSVFSSDFLTPFNLQTMALSATVLGFSIAVALVTAIVFGLAPAVTMSRADLNDALKENTKGSAGRRGSMRGALVVAEVSLAVTLLCGAALLIRSVERLLRESTGVDATSVVTATVQLPIAGYRDWGRVARFYGALGESMRHHADVIGVGVANFLPLDAGWRMPTSSC